MTHETSSSSILKNTPAYAKIRQRKRAAHDWTTICDILDAGLVAHVGFIADGRPMVIPMAYGRIGECLYIHGASTTRIINEQNAAAMCFTVTLLDGLVLAKAAFNHSVNYRSVVAHGVARAVTSEVEYDAALTAMLNHALPGRSKEVRPMLEKERKATGIIAMDIDIASAKVREGMPGLEEDDQHLPIWTGIIPIATTLARPVRDERSLKKVDSPPSVNAARVKTG